MKWKVEKAFAVRGWNTSKLNKRRGIYWRIMVSNVSWVQRYLRLRSRIETSGFRSYFKPNEPVVWALESKTRRDMAEQDPARWVTKFLNEATPFSKLQLIDNSLSFYVILFHSFFSSLSHGLFIHSSFFHVLRGWSLDCKTNSTFW